jgi:hypothetical protein
MMQDANLCPRENDGKIMNWSIEYHGREGIFLCCYGRDMLLFEDASTTWRHEFYAEPTQLYVMLQYDESSHTLGVHLSGCTYIVFIHEVIICSLNKLFILEDSFELQYAFHIFPSKAMLSRTCHFCMNHYSTITLFIEAMKETEWAKSRFAAYQCNIIANF